MIGSATHATRMGATSELQVAILPAPGVDVEPIRRGLARTLEADVRVLADAHGVLELGRRAVVVAAFSSRLGGSFEDLVGLRFAGVPWVAVIPSPHVAVLPTLCRDAGARDVVTLPEVGVRLASAIEGALDASPRAQRTSAAFVAMLTHVLGLSAHIEIEGPRGLVVEIGVFRGMPWSCRSSDGRRGIDAAAEALELPIATIRVSEPREDGARNVFMTWPELLRGIPVSTASVGASATTPSNRGIRVLQGSPPDATAIEASHGEKNVMAKESLDLSALTEIEGFIGACLVDSDSGMVLGQEGGNAQMNLEVAAAGNTEVVRAKRKTMRSLKLNDRIDDILITLGGQYHLIRPLQIRESLFLYIALDRKSANLALARIRLRDFENGLRL